MSEFFLRGINDVSEERLRQIADEGYGAEGDDKLGPGELAAAGACYAFLAAYVLSGGNNAPKIEGLPLWWPWDPKTWKPEDIRRNLVKSSAMIMAEIDKYDRAQEKNEPVQS